MTHQEIQQQEIIERYVRHRLAPAERRAFQEHYFACAECFEQVQLTARFVTAVRQAARQGLFNDALVAAAAPRAWWASLFTPVLGFAAATALLLALGFGWLLSRQSTLSPPPLAHEQPHPSPLPDQSPTPGQNTAQSISPTPAPARPAPTKPSKLPALTPRVEDQGELLAQNRVPSVLLESARDASASSNQLLLPANASSAILRVEIEPGSPFASFQFQLFDQARRPVATVNSGKASARGALAVRVPAQVLQAGQYLVRCYGLKQGQRELVGEYDLRVRRQ